MELVEIEEEEEKNAPIDFDDDDDDDDDDFNNSVLFCEEDDEEVYDLCSSCDENLFAHLVQPCGHRIRNNCVNKNNCQFCGCQLSDNITIDLEYYE